MVFATTNNDNKWKFDTSATCEALSGDPETIEAIRFCLYEPAIINVDEKDIQIIEEQALSASRVIRSEKKQDVSLAQAKDALREFIAGNEKRNMLVVAEGRFDETASFVDLMNSIDMCVSEISIVFGIRDKPENESYSVYCITY